MEKKKVLRTTLAVGMAFIMLFACVVIPNAASAETTNPRPNIDIEKLRAFYMQPTDISGVLNGDVIMNFKVMNHYNDYVNGSYGLPLAEFLNSTTDLPIQVGTIWKFCLNFNAYWNECFNTFSPDVYGPLDLAGTSTNMLLSGGETDFWHVTNPVEDGLEQDWMQANIGPISTHITSVDVSNCWQLDYVDFTGQKLCTEFKALNCERLANLNVTDCDYRLIEVQANGFAEPLKVTAFGDGSVGMTYKASEGKYTLIATEHELGSFSGWYKDGKRISSEAEATFDVSELGEISAVFAGDVNNDGLLDTTDALLIMRASMGLTDERSASICDVDANGLIELSDAVLVMRFALKLA